MNGLDSDFPLVPLRRLSSAPITNGLGEAGNPDNDEAWPRYIRTTDIATVRSLDPKKRLTLPAEIARQAPVFPYDILMTSAGATVGKSYIHLSGESACFAGYLSRWRVRRDRALPEFMAYFTESALFTSQVQAGAVKSTIENYSAAKYRATLAPVPSLAEQQAIVGFLDRETAQIDAFIAKNEELIALLTERRATVIRNATTTGIGSHEDLVDSGDEQVGPIPTRWRMLRLSFLFGSTASGTTPASEQILDADHADVPWVTTGELREAQITGTLRGVSAEILATTPALRLHPEGALLIAMYGATIGRTAILRVPAASNQAVCALSRPTGCDVEYVELALQASRERLRLKAVGGGQPNINQETVRAFRIPVPPLEEQRAIVAYVKEQTAHINAAMANAMRCADLARERRAALISAAVTGKIDVGVSA